MQYSVVIPAFNEAASLPELHREISAAISPITSDYEIIFIDDGSLDDTLKVLEELHRADARVKFIQLARNFGKSAAYMAGFAAATGEIIITLDADLQDDPSQLHLLLDKLNEGSDLVVGWKQNRLDNEPGKTLPSHAFNLLKRITFGLHLHDSNSGFRAMRKHVAASLQLYGDQYRFVPELTHMLGFRVAEVPVQHRPRKYGQSKYGVTRFWTGLLDLLSVRFLTLFTRKPLHFFGTAGLLPILLGCGLETYVLARKILGSAFTTHLAAMIVGVMLILVGVQLIGIGLIGEMIAAMNRGKEYVITRQRGRND